jgi:hypothetical protein
VPTLRLPSRAAAAPRRRLARSLTLAGFALGGLVLPAACDAPTESLSGPTSEQDGATGEISQAVTVGDWSGMTNGQCVHGVYSFYSSRFGIDLTGCCAPAGDIGKCKDCGACMIWESGAVRPNPALFDAYPWGSAMPSTYDIVVLPPTSSNGYGHVACVDHMETTNPADWQHLFVMDTNWSGDEKKAANAHTVSRAPYGFFHLKSLGPVQPACTPSAEVCDGKDNDCNGTVDDGEVCEQALLIDQPAQYAPPTTTDLNGDRRADLCGRAKDGFVCHLGEAGGVGARTLLQPLSDASGWADPSNAATLRMGDVDGDGRADLCARGDAGLFCWTSETTPLATGVTGPAWSDAGSWNATRYFSTIRLLDLDGDGKDDVCARAAKGIVCHRSTGTSFGPEIAGPAWSDAAGFTSAKYYGTLRTGDVDGNGKADLCIRDNGGMLCVPSTGDGFGEPFRGPEWSDASGWGNSLYYSSIRLADIDGDGKADLCARSAASLFCHFSTGTGFGPAVEVAPLSDAAAWADPSNVQTLRTGDIDGDGAADLCIRADASLMCWTYHEGAFVAVDGPDWSDASGWAANPYYQTIRVGDADGDGRADLCGRSSQGWVCTPSASTSFGEPVASPAFSDGEGWTDPTYFSTILFASPICRPTTEVCNGKDDDCDGETDEQGVCDPPPSGAGGAGGSVGSGDGGSAGATSTPSNGGRSGSPSGKGGAGSARDRAVSFEDAGESDGACSVGVAVGRASIGPGGAPARAPRPWRAAWGVAGLVALAAACRRARGRSSRA